MKTKKNGDDGDDDENVDENATDFWTDFWTDFGCLTDFLTGFLTDFSTAAGAKKSRSHRSILLLAFSASLSLLSLAPT